MKTFKSRVSVPENYTVKATGEQKTFWHDIGTITTFVHEDGRKNSELFIPAYNLKAQVFQITPKQTDTPKQEEPDLTIEPLPATPDQA